MEFSDGIEPVIVGFAYFDVFELDGHPHAVASRGSLYRALDPKRPFTPLADWDYGRELWEAEGKNPSDNPFQHAIDEARKEGKLSDTVKRCRHFSTRLIDDRLEFYYTRVGDAPERILMSVVKLDADGDGKLDPCSEWKPSFPPREILAPEHDWEGAGFPVKSSRPSAKSGGVRQLRDPFVFQDQDGTAYLFYTGQGEAAIGVVELSTPSKPRTDPKDL